jgi:hypothetical protein
MPFYIHNSDSSVNIVIPDGTIDTTSLSLSLIGRNVADYGQYFAENTILQLENFASIAAPNPETLLIGQQWFDKGDNIMRVWDGTQWKAQTGITVENNFPITGGGEGDSDGGTTTPPSTGSGFFNQEDLKLYIWDGVQYLPAAYGGEFSSQYSNDTALGTPSRYGTKVRNIFLASTEGPKAVLALVYNNDSDVGSVNQGTTETKYGKETIISLFSDHKTFNITNEASSTEGENINYYPELVGVGGICSTNGGRILPGINLRQYGQEGGGEAEVPQATRSRYSDGTGTLLNLEREGIIEDFISNPGDPAIQADLIFFNQIVSTSESIIPDFSGLTIGDSNDPYEVGYFNTVSFSNIISESNNISIDVDNVSFEGNIVVDGDTIFNGDVDFPGAVTLSSITTGGASIPGTVTGTWTLTAGSTFEATYADLAENFRADADYTPGTVVKLGGDEEITICDKTMCTDVFGVISQNPAYIMNAGGGIPVALQGRTPVKLIGSAKKGDRLVSAGQAGYAMVLKEDKYYDPRIIIGRALEDVEYDSGTVMAVIGVK